MGNGNQARRAMWAAALLATTAMTGTIWTSPAVAQDVAQRLFDIPAQPLPSALTLFGRQSGLQVSVPAALAQGRTSTAVSGSLAPLAALSQLLTGTGLTYRISGNIVTLEPAPEASNGAISLGPVRVEGSGQGVAGNDIPTPKTDRAATDRSHSYAARGATVAGKTAQDLREIPQSVTVVTRQRMDDQNIVSLEDALRQTTGVTAVPYGGDGTAYFDVRGFQAEVQYDGIPTTSGFQNLGQYDMAIYDRVEVLRGPSGLLQGGGAPAGTVNLVRKRPHDTFGWSGSLMGGSWNNFYGNLDVTGPLDSAGNIRGRFVAAGDDRDYFTDKKHERHGTLYGIVEFDLDSRTTLTLSGAYQDQSHVTDYGVGTYTDGRPVNPPRSSFFGIDWGHDGTRYGNAYAALDHDFGNGWSAQASVDYRHLVTFGPYGFALGVNPDNSATYYLQKPNIPEDWVGTDAHVSGPVQLFGRTHTFLIGANYAWFHETTTAGSAILTVPDIFHMDIPEQPIPYTSESGLRTTQYGVYAQARISLADPLTLVAGARLTNYESQTASGLPNDLGAYSTSDKIDGHFTPSLALLYDVTKTITLYASYASIFTPQDGDLVYGGGSIKPSTGEQYEVGAKGAFFHGALNASAALFDIEDTNRAFGDPDHPNYFLAAGKARSRGAELEVSGEVLPGWSVFAGYTYLDTKVLDDATEAGNVLDSEEPKHTFKLWSTYRVGDPDRPGFQFGGGVRVMSETSRLDSAPQPTYAVVDAQVGYRLNREWSTTLTVNNLFDKTYYIRSPGSFFGLYGDPRSFTIALRKSF